MTASSPAQGSATHTRYDLVATRYAGDVSRLYVEARAAGLVVSHYSARSCQTFDGLPKPGAALGVFRNVGTLAFYKDERRWEVRACCDAGSVDLSTLIACGLGVVEAYGRHPGHWTRTRGFTHEISKRTGKRIAWVGVAYQLGADDLLASQSHDEEVPDFLDLSTWADSLGV